MKNDFYDKLDFYVPNPKCELDYHKDYELLIATILSAQCTDKTVNKVTNKLFSKYDLNKLSRANIKDIIDIIKPCGNYTKKSQYIIQTAYSLIKDYQGIVPNNREYLESLPGVGHKTANVVLKNLYNLPCIPVDTHVIRVSNRLGIVKDEKNPQKIEQVLMKKIPKDRWNRVSEQLLLFGRYTCKSKNPLCEKCLFINQCKKER